MYGASELATGETRDLRAVAQGPGADARRDDAVVEEHGDHEREQGRLRAQHAQVVGHARRASTARSSRCGRGSTRAGSSPSSRRPSRSTAPPTRTASSPSGVTSARWCWCRDRHRGGPRVGLPRRLRRDGQGGRALLPRHLPADVRLHPPQHPHDPRPGELVARQRRGRGHPRPPPGLRDHHLPDRGLRRDRDRARRAVARDPRGPVRDRGGADARRVRALAQPPRRLLGEGGTALDRRRDHRRGAGGPGRARGPDLDRPRPRRRRRRRRRGGDVRRRQPGAA